MTKLAIKADDISKQYRLGQVGTGTISHDLNRWWASIRGKEDPYLKVGETNDRSQKGGSEYVWSLKDINFEIEQGSAVGIIGKNGAGKSTLLKLLSKVTQPTTGSFKVNGRIASLLEVGTGFHPEMTGRENIYLNGAILGMNRREIKRKFDEIVDFAGIERYIDTPVKRYSSGMYVRLAFAVAAHLESEILIVDEVLAVGDAEFQKKCLGKMGDISKGEGRTVLFVSHNMAAVKTLCDRGIVLQNGTSVFEGDAQKAIEFYLNENRIINNFRSFEDTRTYNNKEFRLSSIRLKKVIYDNDFSNEILDENSQINLITEIEIKNSMDEYHISYVLENDSDGVLFSMSSYKKTNLTKGMNQITCEIPKGFLNVGSFSLSLYIIKNVHQGVFFEDNIINFKINQGGKELGDWMGVEPGFIKPNLDWYKK